jgi:hypothetical protein
MGGLLLCGWVAAQDTPRSPVKVLIGSDGSVQIFDAKTGKEVYKFVPQRDVVRQPGDEAQKQLNKAREYLERMLQEPAKKPAGISDPKKAEKVLIQPLELQIAPVGEKPKVVLVQPRAGNLEQKLDHLLVEMQKLRKDVDAIKNKLGMNVPEAGWHVVPAGKDPAKGKKPAGPRFEIKPAPPGKNIDPALQKEIELLLKELQAEQKGLDDVLKKLEGKASTPKKLVVELPRPIDRNAQIERRIELMLREIEAMRQEIMKNKAPQ